jgi:hypothetical protein
MTWLWLLLAFWGGLLYRLWRGPRATVPPAEFVSPTWLAQYRRVRDDN